MGLGLCCSLVMYLTADVTVRLMLGINEGTAYDNACLYMRTIALFYTFCFTGNTFAGYFNGIGKVSIPFIGAISHITLRVILSWLLVPRLGLQAVAIATGLGWIWVNLFWTIIYLRLGRRK
jgi:Na+-driven multidrug efflux pump